MKFSKILALLLCTTLLIGTLTACGESQQNETAPQTVTTEPQSDPTEPQIQQPKINPALYEAFGEEMIAGEEETIADLVNGLEACYSEYKQNGNFNEFADSVSKSMEPYKNYLKEISSELQTMYESETDNEKKQKLLTLQGQSIGYIAPESTWTNYKFFIDMNLQPSCTEQEAEKALIDYINAISNFFYCQPIAE